jgi:hypothetical protein
VKCCRNTYETSVSKAEDKRLLERPRRGWENNIEMGLKEMRSWSEFIWLRLM